MTTTEVNPFLAGNYAPVDDEITEFSLTVRGAIPSMLAGRYLRTGPNPHGTPPQPYHWFLGSGMIHGVELRDGAATWYRNRWVRTGDIAAAFGEPAPTGPKQPMYDASNTNVVGFAGRILSLTEGAHPYELSPDLDTIGRFDPTSGSLPHGMTAHPKIDPVTGYLHGFSYWFVEPYVYYHVVDPSGAVTVSEPITIPRAVSMHDFAITRDHVLIFDQPYIFDLEVAATNGFPFRWAPEHGARLGILPRNGTDVDVRWIETEACYCFHPMNAYGEGNRIVVDVPKMTAVGGTVAPEADRLSLERWTVDLDAGGLRVDVIDDEGQEFCRVNESILGSKHRFGYTMASSEPGTGHTGIYGATRLFKHDFASASRAVHDFGAGRHPGEFVFVTDPERSGDEDGGWMMGLVYDAARDRSELVILDAQNFAGAEVAAIELPRRVPYGFHGNWVADPH